jgi:hypothetical protein
MLLSNQIEQLKNESVAGFSVAADERGPTLVAFVEAALERACSQQHERLFALGRRLVPTLTLEDLMQPNDYEELEGHPLFRYEEGVLEGLLSALAVLRAELALSGESPRRSGSQ